MRQEGEPSVGEILRSIKKVMARDNREILRQDHHAGSPADGDDQPSEPAQAEEAEDVPELSELDADLAIGAEPDHAQVAAGGEDAGEATVSQSSDDEAASPQSERGDEPAGEGGAADGTDTEPLAAEDTAAAMRQSLAALALLAEPSRPGESSVESMVRQMLRPMLSQWLDTHLPEIVERQVKAEIARIVGTTKS